MQEMANPQVRGTASGLQGLCGQLGASLAGYPLVLVQKLYGWQGVFSGLAGGGAVAAALFLGLWYMVERGKPDHRQDTPRAQKKDL